MKYEYKDLITIKTGKENDWFYRTIKSLESIDEDYVLFLLEDYFLSKNQYNKTYDSIIDYMYSENIYYYQLSSVQSKSKEAVADYNKDISYPISLQAAIWNRKEFLNILYEIYDTGAKTPWEFEKYFVLLNKEPKKIKNYTSGIRYNTEDILGYKNGVLQGKWILKTVNFYKKRGIVIDTTKRGIQTKLDSIKSAIDSMKTTISGKLDTVNSTINKANTDIVAAINAMKASNDTKNDAIITALQGLVTQVNRNTSNINSLNGRVDALEQA